MAPVLLLILSWLRENHKAQEHPTSKFVIPQITAQSSVLIVVVAQVHPVRQRLVRPIDYSCWHGSDKVPKLAGSKDLRYQDQHILAMNSSHLLAASDVYMLLQWQAVTRIYNTQRVLQSIARHWAGMLQQPPLRTDMAHWLHLDTSL